LPPEPQLNDSIAGNIDSSPLSSTSNSLFMPRSVSTPHLRGEVLANTEECYARHLEEVHKGKWADRWAVPTPSTASPSRAPSRGSQSSSSLSRSSYSSLSDSRPGSSADSMYSSSSGVRRKDPVVKAQLKDARHRAKASFEALQSQLNGSAPVRYSTWPMGCAVRVSFDGPVAVGGVSDSSDLLAVIVRHNPVEKTFEVKLHDGSTRVVPERCVTRVRRGSTHHSSADSTCRVGSRKPTVCEASCAVAKSPAQIVHKAFGHADRHPPSSRPQPSRMESDQVGMLPLPNIMGSFQFPCEA
jgi:hypothetical protein